MARTIEGETRKFNNRTYTRMAYAHFYGAAERLAKSFREAGYLVRIVPNKQHEGSSDIYVHLRQ